MSVAILSDKQSIREGTTVYRTGRALSVPVGEALLGRVVNALGEPIDGKGPADAKEYPSHRKRGPGHHRAQGRVRSAADRASRPSTA